MFFTVRRQSLGSPNSPATRPALRIAANIAKLPELLCPTPPMNEA
jgi:hypothetical protein